MRKSVKLFMLIGSAAAMNFLSGCAPRAITNSSVICRITFDYNDEGLEALNVENLRALASFKEACGK